MTEFTGSGVDTTEERKPGKSVRPGIHEMMIADMQYFESSENKTPAIKLTLMTAPVEGLVDESGNTIGQKCEEMWWMSPKAWNNEGKPNGAAWCTQAKLAILADKLGVREQYNATTAQGAEAFVNALAPIFKGKKARFAIGGKEDQFEKDGEMIKFVRPQLLTFKFVEELSVPREQTTLKYDENNPYHFIKMEESDSPMADIAEINAPSGTSEDSPW